MNKPTRITAPTRRRFLAATSGTLAGLATLAGGLDTVCSGAVPQDAVSREALSQKAMSQKAMSQKGSATLRYCLNTSSINNSKVPVREQLKVAANAGYDAVELWLRDIEKYVSEGRSLPDLASEISDLGLGVDSAIAFGNWLADDAAQRKAGLEQCKRDMEVVAALGGTRIAAPPVGATKEPGLDLRAAGERYHALLEVGKAAGVTPQLELWGFSKNLSTLEEVLFVAAAAQHPEACVLLDVYHMYKGGSDFSNVGLIPATKMHCLHMNDYPAKPDRETIGDADRVYPGDGIAPMDMILKTLVDNGFTGTLSLELFNRSYWEQPAAEVAKLGLEKMRACVASALG